MGVNEILNSNDLNSLKSWLPSVSSSSCEEALLGASWRGWTEGVLILRDWVDNLNCSEDGRTALWHAAAGGHAAVIILLLEQRNYDGQPPSCAIRTSGAGSTPLIAACERRRWDAAKALLEHPFGPSADVLRLTDSIGRSAFWHLFGVKPSDDAAPAARLAFADTLRLRGVDMALAENDYGRSALRFSAECGNVDSVAYLLQHAPQLVDVACTSGQTPLYVAAAAGHLHIARMLLGAGADLSIRDKSGHSPLSTAINNGHLPVVQLLIEHGASYLAPDGEGTRPLVRARQRGKTDIVVYLAVRTFGALVGNHQTINE